MCCCTVHLHRQWQPSSSVGPMNGMYICIGFSAVHACDPKNRTYTGNTDFCEPQERHVHLYWLVHACGPKNRTCICTTVGNIVFCGPQERHVYLYCLRHRPYIGSSKSRTYICITIDNNAFCGLKNSIHVHMTVSVLLLASCPFAGPGKARTSPLPLAATFAVALSTACTPVLPLAPFLSVAPREACTPLATSLLVALRTVCTSILPLVLQYGTHYHWHHPFL